MKRLSSLVLSFSLTCTLVTLLFFTYALPLQTQIETQTPKEAVLERVKNLERIFSLIEKHYLYPDSVDWEKCWSLMVMKLSGGTLYEKRVEREKDSEPKASTCPDKYSRFLTVEETKSDDIEMSGHFSGVGIEISEEKGEVVVKKVFKGPSEGIVKEGDVIIGSRNKEEKTMTPIRDSRDVVKRLRGVSGAIIYITVKRNGTILELPGITRGDIKINSVFSRKLSSNIGYTRINQFGFETADDLEEQVGELRSGGVSRLVLDLRYNPGGVLPAALETLFYFSPDPKTDRMLTVRFRAREVAHTVKCPLPFEVLGKAIICGRFEYPKTKKEKSPGTMSDLDGIVVLVNKHSASASELVAGTLQDWARTKGAKVKIVGEKSYGKCVGQEIFPFPDGSSFHLTTFEFLVGNNKASVCGGVTPDYAVSQPDDFEFPIKVEDVDISKDPQLKKAIELLTPAVPVPQPKPKAGT